jgi:hypothetical protein
MALFSWIIFTVAIGFIKPPPHSCWREMNSTHQVIERVGYTTSTISPIIKLRVKRQTITQPSVASKFVSKTTKEMMIDQEKSSSVNKTTTLAKSVLNTTSMTTRRRKTTTSRTTPKTTTRAPVTNDDDDEDDEVGSEEEDDSVNEPSRLATTTKSNKPSPEVFNLLPISKPQKTMGNPLSITHTNLSLVKPLASPVLYDTKDVRNVFMVFLLLIIIGEFFSAPAITLAVSSRDEYRYSSCTLTFFLGCLYIDTLRSRHGIVRTTTHVR